MVQFTGHANGRVGFPPPCCRSGSRNCEKGRRRMGEQGMTCLYECLREVGLQRYYARFISMGVCRVTHLSALTMEEYPILGIQSMKDRTSLFHLVQLVKTLNPESHEDDDDYDPDAYRSEKNRAACEGSFINGVDASCEDRDDEENGEDNKKKAAIIKNNTDSHRGPFSVRRRLDFSGEMTDPHPNCMGSSLDSAKVFARHQSGNNQRSDQGRVSVMQMQHESDTPTVGCGSKDPTRNGNADIYRRSSAHRPGENTKPDVTRHSCIYGSQAPSTKQPSPGLMTTHKLSSKPHRNYNPRCTTVTSTRPSSKPTSHKRRKTVSRRLKPGPGREDHENWRPTDKPVVQSERRAGYNYGLPLNSLPLPNKLKTGEQRIRVCVRKRPLTHTEEVRGEADIVTTQDAECVVVYESKEAVDLTQYILQHRFYFDQVFGEESSNEEVYQRTAYPLVQHMLNGGKATCFAYGQTGAGKTHTMLGCSPGRPGLYALAAHDIFTHLCATHTPSPMLVYVSFFEIYCGQLYDLLDHRKRLFAREDGKKMVQITGLREFRVDSVDSLLEVISWGTEERTQGVSGVNPVSSRSHALLQIQLRSLKQQLAGRMWFVDLAGSERAADTREPDRQSRIEGAEINQSLLALKECIRSLDQEQSHTPFRQSKLTQVLKDSFVGNSKTCMIANISPGHLATEHTLNTLRYADRVKELKGRGRGARGGPRSKISALPKPIKTNGGNTSGGNSREKSPPKKPKLSNRGTRFPETPTGTASTPAAMFFSTPKKSLAGKRRGRGALKDEIGTYCHLTLVASSLGMSDARTKQEILGERNERAERGSSRRRDKEGRYGGTECADHTNRDSNTATEKDERQPTKEQNFSCDVAGEAAASAMPLSVAQKPSGFRHSGVERRKNTWEREGEERTCRDQRRQVRCESGNGRDSLAEKSGRRGCRENSAKLEGRPGEHWQTGGEREKERENHLRWYHQQLQQCLPSAFSQSPLSPSPFVSPSLSSSGQPNVSASLSLAAPSAIPPAMYHSLKDLLEVYRASVEVRGHGGGGHVEHHGGISQIDFPASESHNTKDNGADKTVALGEKSGVPLKKAETGDGEWRGEREEEGGLLEVARRGERGERRDGLRPMEVAKSRWAWVKTTATEEADRTMDAALSEGEVSECSSFDSEETWRREATAGVTGVSDVVVEEDYSANEKEEVGGKHFGFTHSRDYPTQDHPQHLAPAERPLSPAHNASGTHPTDINLGDLSLEPKDNNHCTEFLSLPLQYAALAFPPRDVPLNSTSGVSGFLINREISNFTLTPPLCRPFTTPSTNEGPDPTMVAVAKIAAIESYPGCPIYSPSWVKTSVSPPVRSSADDCGCNTDPLSLSSPQVDRQAATANKTVMVDNYTQPKRDMLNGADFLLEIGKTKPHIPGAALVSLQYEGNDEGSGAQPGTKALRNKICASLPKRPPHPTQSHVQSISHHDQCRGDTVSLRPHVQVSEASTEKASEYLRSAYNQTLSSVTVPSESDLNHLKMAARQSHSLLACHSNDPQSPLKVRRPSPTECTGSHQSRLENTSNRHIRPTISSSEDWGHAQWCVVKAQLKQLQEMEALCHKDGTLLCQQEYMAFGEYVHRLEEIMERKACCIQSMKNWLHRYLVPTLSGHQNSKDQTPDTLSSETGISVL